MNPHPATLTFPAPAPTDLQLCLRELAAIRKAITLLERRIVTAEPAIASPDGKWTSMPEQIIALVAVHYDVSRAAILGRSRKQHISWARHVAIYLVKTHTDFSFEQVGIIFQRDHGSICNSLSAVVDRCSAEPAAKSSLAIIEARLAPLLPQFPPVQSDS